MSLTAFIRDHHEEIISQFAVFARTLMPPGTDMTEAELRDHANEILTAVVQDMSIAQTSEEQSRKSEGRGSANTMRASGRLHADDRIHHGFTFRFGALRVSRAPRDRPAAQFRDQFIGVLSHDLPTPLGAITAGAALLTLPEDNPQRRSWVVTRIMNSAQRMERMIEDLLDVTRARLGGSIALKRRPVDLQQVCDEAMMEIRAGQPDAGVRLQAGGDLHGDWDPDRLAQVVSNLVGNAIQHGSGTPVTVTAHGDGDSVTLAVHNGGPPISRFTAVRV